MAKPCGILTSKVLRDKPVNSEQGWKRILIKEADLGSSKRMTELLQAMAGLT